MYNETITIHRVIISIITLACGDESIATITPDEFKKLEQGMSLDEVEEIVGGKSKIQKQKKMKTYDCF